MKVVPRKRSALFPLALCVLVCVGCPTGDVTVPQSDSTPPTMSLQVAVEGSNSTTAVSTGSAPATLSLTSKTVKLNIAATAKDADSGVQDLEIWIANQLKVRCESPTSCSTSGPGSASQPMWSSTSAKVSPGGLAVSSSILSESLDPVATGLLHPAEQPPAGGSLTESFTIWVQATNQLGGTARTPDLTVVSKLP